MLQRRSVLFRALALAGLLPLFAAASAQPKPAAFPANGLQKRWLFIFRDMSDPKEIDRMIARFPRAHADGYNGVVFNYNVAEAKAPELREAAKKYGLDLIVTVMGGAHDRNYEEGLLSKDALFVAHNGTATLQPENPTLVNTDFENVKGNHFQGWGFQDDEGVTTFADHEVTHGGKTSLRIENIGKNSARHARLSQPIKLTPHRQYRISFWLKSENLVPADPEVKILSPDTEHAISFQTFHTEKTQDWTHYDLVFNSMDYRDALLYLGSWYGKEGKMWWDDLKIEEVGLVNLLRRRGCPVTVRGEKGQVYEEGRDYAKLVDPDLHPWRAYHTPPDIKLTANSRIVEGERLRVSYYNPIIVYEDRVTSCLSEPKIFDDWREEVVQANKLLHPAAFFMSHDELLAWNVHKAAQIIRDIRPDAEIWVWNDMFDPMHNAVDHFYAVNGPLKGSWEGLDKDVGIVNWNGGVMGKNCKFFPDLGLKQILSGYYDGDDDGAAITQWIAKTRGIPGIVGAMYTTWEDRYDPMDAWAARAWGAPKAP